MALRLPLQSSSRLASFALLSTVQPSHYSREIYCFFISRQVEVGESVAWPISNHNVSVSRVREGQFLQIRRATIIVAELKNSIWLLRARQTMRNRFLITTVWYYI